MNYRGVRGGNEINQEENVRSRKKVEVERGRKKIIWEVGVGILSSALQCAQTAGVWSEPECGHSRKVVIVG